MLLFVLFTFITIKTQHNIVVQLLKVEAGRGSIVHVVWVWKQLRWCNCCVTCKTSKFSFNNKPRCSMPHLSTYNVKMVMLLLWNEVWRKLICDSVWRLDQGSMMWGYCELQKVKNYIQGQTKMLTSFTI